MTEMEQSPSAPAASPRRAGGLVRVLDDLSLKAHRLALRFDLAPVEFGQQGLIDELDAPAVRAEWLRCLRLWADYNPEEVFALKVGGCLLGAALLALLAMVSAFG